MDNFSPEKDEFLKEFYIPSYIFLPELPTRHPSFVPSCPVVVFINTKSGGQLGSALLATYCNLLNKLQVLNFMPRDTDTCEIYQSILLAKNVISRFSTWKRKLPTRCCISFMAIWRNSSQMEIILLLKFWIGWD